MKLVRFSVNNKINYGLLEGSTIYSVRGNPLAKFTGHPAGFKTEGESYKLSEVKLKAPCLPSKIVALGLNYHSHAEETRLPIPSVPLIFMKPSTAVIGPDDNIVLPRLSRRVDYEGELGIVIGKITKDVPKNKAGDHIIGYTCVNDVSARYAQKEDGQWTRAKSYDTFAPIGPCIETDILPDDLKVETYLNNELRQSASTRDLIFGVAELVSFISNVMTLLPGDIIATGTPAGIGRMKPGDVVEVTIEGIGTLRNYVVSQSEQ